MTKILLHICCGICAGGVVKRLREEGYSVTGFFYNPNIQPLTEYKKRLAVAQEVAKLLAFSLITEPYVTGEWELATKGLEGEPEGGRRCFQCYHLRLQKTYAKAQEIGADFFTTTLTVSPHKKAEVINQIGREIGGEQFLAEDFKKHDGFKRSMDFAKEQQLYRQHYCGCLYSQRSRHS